DLEDENRLLQNEYNRLCKQHIEKSQLINEYNISSNEQMMSYKDLEMLREAKLLRHHKSKLETRMKILEEHNKQLELQLNKSKQLLRPSNTRSPPLSQQSVRQINLGYMSAGDGDSSPLQTSGTSLRRSVERSLERQPNLITIDNLFSMADDINRAVVDLVQMFRLSSVLARTCVKPSQMVRSLTSLNTVAVEQEKLLAKNETPHLSESKRTPLFDFHVKHKGRLVNFSGWQLPVQYSESIGQSHKHTRAHSGLFDVSHMLQIKVHGKDRIKFMEQLVVSDIQNLKLNSSCLTLYTNKAGGILDDLIITKASDYLFVVSNAGRAENDLRHLNEHLEKSKDLNVDIEVLSDRALLALQGPSSSSVLQKFVPIDLTTFAFMQSASTTFANTIPCRVNRSGYTGEDGFEISVPANNVEQVASFLLESNEVALAGLGCRDSMRLEAGLCLYGNDIDEKTTPVEADLTWTIGKRRRELADFPGADIILDQIRNGVERKRIGVVSNGSCPRFGAEITDSDGKKIGQVTSGCPSPSLKHNIAIAYVSTNNAKPGTRVYLTVRNKKIEGNIVKLPFVPTKYYKPKNVTKQ
ncbi:unnamed protein product, partial [Didymodactylos carnosus]